MRCNTPFDRGRGWFVDRITQREYDISGDLGGGTNDHMGFILATENREIQKEAGLTRPEIEAATYLYTHAEEPEDVKSLHSYFNKLFRKFMRIRMFTGTYGINVGVDIWSTDDLWKARDFLMRKGIKTGNLFIETRSNSDTMRPTTVEEFLADPESTAMRRNFLPADPSGGIPKRKFTRADESLAEELAEMLQIHKVERRPGAGTSTWITGKLGKYKFQALVFPGHADNPEWEIEDSRVSKLWLSAGNKTVFEWDRGLVVPPADRNAAEAVMFIIAGAADYVYGPQE